MSSSVGAATARSTSANQPHSISLLIQRCNAGDAQAHDELISRLYRDLRRIAAVQLRSERPNHTLQPTALVHEAYARIAQQSDLQLKDRAHFLSAASNLMHQILVDHGRARQAMKRGGVQRQVTLDDGLGPSESQAVDILILDEVIQRLAQLNARHAQIVELHFFGGLTFEEIASVVGLGVRTIKRDWKMARAWLRLELTRTA